MSEDRIVLDITVEENTREEDGAALEQLLHDVLHGVYDQREFHITEADDE